MQYSIRAHLVNCELDSAWGLKWLYLSFLISKESTAEQKYTYYNKNDADIPSCHSLLLLQLTLPFFRFLSCPFIQQSSCRFYSCPRHYSHSSTPPLSLHSAPPPPALPIMFTIVIASQSSPSPAASTNRVRTGFDLRRSSFPHFLSKHPRCSSCCECRGRTVGRHTSASFSSSSAVGRCERRNGKKWEERRCWRWCRWWCNWWRAEEGEERTRVGFGPGADGLDGGLSVARERQDAGR